MPGTGIHFIPSKLSPSRSNTVRLPATQRPKLSGAGKKVIPSVCSDRTKANSSPPSASETALLQAQKVVQAILASRRFTQPRIKISKI